MIICYEKNYSVCVNCYEVHYDDLPSKKNL